MGVKQVRYIVQQTESEGLTFAQIREAVVESGAPDDAAVFVVSGSSKASITLPGNSWDDDLRYTEAIVIEWEETFAPPAHVGEEPTLNEKIRENIVITDSYGEVVRKLYS